MSTFRITIGSCHDETLLDLDLTVAEVITVRKIALLSYAESPSCCAPTLKIEATT